MSFLNTVTVTVFLFGQRMSEKESLAHVLSLLLVRVSTCFLCTSDFALVLNFPKNWFPKGAKVEFPCFPYIFRTAGARFLQSVQFSVGRSKPWLRAQGGVSPEPVEFSETNNTLIKCSFEGGVGVGRHLHIMYIYIYT